MHPDSQVERRGPGRDHLSLALRRAGKVVRSIAQRGIYGLTVDALSCCLERGHVLGNLCSLSRRAG